MVQEKPNMIQAALIGGVFLGVTSALPIIEWFNCVCCLLLMGGGVLASFIYVRDNPIGVTYGDGALLGLFTGLIGAIVWTVVEIPLTYFQLKFGMGMEDIAELEELLSDPDIPPFLQEFIVSILNSGAISPFLIFFTLFTHLVLAVIFATIGGIIGVALFQRGNQVGSPPPTVGSTPPPAGPQGEIPRPPQQ
jgi:hypothetical protein